MDRKKSANKGFLFESTFPSLGNTKVEVRNLYMKPASTFAHVLTLHLECSVEIFCPVKLDIVKSFLKSTHS